MGKKLNKIIIISLSIFNLLAITPKAQCKTNPAKGPQPIFRVDTEEKKIALTFDINWAEKEYLFDILDTLNKYNVKSTFFIMGGWVNYKPENKEKLIKIKGGGHEIGNHSYIHPSFTKIDKGRISEELKKTDNVIYETVGIKTKLFRFPSGDYNSDVLKYVTDLGYQAIQWDVDSVDWKQSGEQIEYERVMKRVKAGSILLFHNNAKYTPNNLERILKELISQGYSIVTVGELIYQDNYFIDENGTQRKI